MNNSKSVKSDGGVELTNTQPNTISTEEVDVIITNKKNENDNIGENDRNRTTQTVDNTATQGRISSSGLGISQQPCQKDTKLKEQTNSHPLITAPPPTADKATMSQILGTLTSFLIMPMPGYPFLKYETAGNLERNHYVSLERYAIYDGIEENYNKCPKPIFYIIKNCEREYEETKAAAVKSFFPACKSICPPVKPTDPPSWIMLNPEKGEEFAKIYRIAEDPRHYRIDFPNNIHLIMDRPNWICYGDTRCLPLAFYCNPAIDEHVELSSQDDKKIVKSNQQVLYGGSIIKKDDEEVFSNILPVDTGFHIYPTIFGCNCLGCCNRNRMFLTPDLWRLKLNCIPKLCCESRPLYEMETIKVLHGKSGRPDVIINFKNETKSSPFNSQFYANVTRINFSNNNLSVEEKLACIMTEIIPHSDDDFEIGLI